MINNMTTYRAKYTCNSSNIYHGPESMKGRADKQVDRWMQIVNCRGFVSPKHISVALKLSYNSLKVGQD